MRSQVASQLSLSVPATIGAPALVRNVHHSARMWYRDEVTGISYDAY